MGTIMRTDDDTTPEQQAAAEANLRILSARPEDDTTPAQRAAISLRLLAAGLTELPARPSDPPGRTRSPHGSLPIHAGILDYMARSRDEVVEHARSAVPADQMQRPIPREHEQVYAWLDEHTPYLDPAARKVAEAIEYRQALEHGLRARDTTVIRKERCPSCRCWSLTWRAAEQRAVCFNGHDTLGGRARRYTLAELAEKAVENLTIRAAT
jgi:hypothetical protein